MTPEQLKDQFRIDVADPELPGDGATPDEDSLWKDAEIYAYIDEAQKEFARRTDYFMGTSTSPITAGEKFVVLDDRITKVRHRATLLNERLSVEVTNLADLESKALTDDYGLQTSVDWEYDTGRPEYMLMDVEQGKGRLVPIPVANDTLSMYIYRLPLTDIIGAASAFEVTQLEHQRGLLLWAKKLAYEKQDADTTDLKRSQAFGSEFLDYCARVKNELKRVRKRSGTVKYGGL